MPGIHDAHMHLMYAGLALLNKEELGMDTTPAKLAERIAHGACECDYAQVYGDWLKTSVFSVPDFDRSCLDAKFPDTPVYIGAGAGHNMYANTVLLKKAGYDLQHEPDSRATYYRRREDGSLTGELPELAMTKAALALPRPALSHGNVDESKITVTDLAERVAHHDAKGRTVKIHATGHGSVQKALDAFEMARKKNPNGRKHEIAHCNSVHSGRSKWVSPVSCDSTNLDFPRFKKLNVTAEMSPAFFMTHPLAASAPDLYDWDFTGFDNLDVLTTLGSDWAGSFDPLLFPHCAGIVERAGGGSKERGGGILCQIMTLAGAEAVGKQNDFGSIEVRKKANFIAVGKNLAKDEFAEARVLKTWFEGQLVWDNSDQ